VEDGLANLCFLINAASARKHGGSADGIVEDAVCANVRAREALRDATADGRWLAVSVDGFGVRDKQARPGLISIGDAAAFIDPFTGSGMLLALESSGLLAECIAETGADDAGLAGEYARRYGKKFRRRFGSSSLLRRAAFAPGIASLGIATVFHYRATRRIFAALTRHRAAE
jgi:flavin-dependent dehydrogenase